MRFELSSLVWWVTQRWVLRVAALMAFSLASGDVWAQGAGTVQFAASSYQVTENEGSVTISVMRVRGSSGAISVDYTVTPGTATPLTDYDGANGILSCVSELSAKEDPETRPAPGRLPGLLLTLVLS